jgi:nuclease-like protein
MSDALESVSADGDLKLASGRLVTLEGVRLADSEHREPALAWLRAHIGQAVLVAARSRAPDRWGRVPASLALADRPVRLDLAQGLVDQGLALADAGEADALCAPELLALEDSARGQGLGLWAADRYKPASADDSARIRALAGRFALVEGRIRSIGERPQRTYLNFGSDWANDFTITIPKRTWAALRARGLTARALSGRRVRGRGVIEIWRGPTMEIAVPDMLELLDPDRTRP